MALRDLTFPPAGVPSPVGATSVRVTAGPAAPAPPATAQPAAAPRVGAAVEPDTAWRTVVWDDPVNLMSYVTWVFQELFGYSREHAERLMLDVHQQGRAVVSHGARERMEYDASRLHAYGLWATVDR